jgi:hypothetical protein
MGLNRTYLHSHLSADLLNKLERNLKPCLRVFPHFNGILFIDYLLEFVMVTQPVKKCSAFHAAGRLTNCIDK